MKGSHYIFVPVEICQWAIKNKFIRPFQVYVELKMMCNGCMRLENTELRFIAKSLGLKSIRAIRNNIKILLDSNWIGYDIKTGVYYIRGFEKVRKMYGFKRRTGAEYNTKEIKNFKAFIAGAVIGYLVNVQRRHKRLGARNNGRAYHPIHNANEYFPVANAALAKILGISISTASELKHLAQGHGYVLIRKRYKKTNKDGKFKNQIKKANPEISLKVRVVNGEVMLQEPDEALSCIRFKRRKKIDTYIMEYKGYDRDTIKAVA